MSLHNWLDDERAKPITGALSIPRVVRAHTIDLNKADNITVQTGPNWLCLAVLRGVLRIAVLNGREGVLREGDVFLARPGLTFAPASQYNSGVQFVWLEIGPTRKWSTTFGPRFRRAPTPRSFSSDGPTPSSLYSFVPYPLVRGRMLPGVNVTLWSLRGGADVPAGTARGHTLIMPLHSIANLVGRRPYPYADGPGSYLQVEPGEKLALGNVLPDGRPAGYSEAFVITIGP